MTVTNSSSFTMVDRLVWFRHFDENTDETVASAGNDKTTTTTTKSATDDDSVVEWVPAIYYASHTEMQQQFQLQCF